MIERLKDLINIESITRNEQDICDHLEHLLSKTSGSLTRQDHNLIWKSDRWQEDRKTIALVGHIDTVPFEASNWKCTTPTQAKEIDGKIYGRGSCDMKGGVSIILDLIINQHLGHTYNIIVIIYEGEEFGIPNGLTTLIEKNLLPPLDFAIVLEPTDQKIISGVFSNLSIEVTAAGKAGHSSIPIDKNNAIYRLTDYIQATRKIPLQKVYGTSEALSVTLIEGGSAANITPEKARATIDMRAHPGLSQEVILNRFPKAKDIVLEVLDWSPGNITKRDHPILQKLVDQAQVPHEIAPYWTDIGQLGIHDIPAVNFGPGSINQCHIADEFVEISQLKWVRQQLINFLA